MSEHAARRPKLLLRSGAVTAVILAHSAQAHAQVRGVVDVSVQGTVASSPFLEDNGGGSAVAIGVQIDPSIYYEGDEVTTAALRGTVAFDRYSSGYGTTSSLGLTAAVQHRISPRTSVGLTASAYSTRSAVRDFLRNPGLPGNFLPNSGELDPTQAVPDPGTLVGLDPGQLVGLDPDLTEAGTRGRTSNYRVGVSLEHTLSPVDSILFAGSAAFSSSEDGAASDYRSDQVSASYRRTLSERTSANAGLIVGRADYQDAGLVGQSDGRYLTPTVGISHRLSETITADVSLGASVIDVEGADGGSTSVTLAGSAGICRLQSGGNLCASVSRAAQPTSFGGITSVTSAQIGYSWSLTLRDSLQTSARYSRRDDSLLPQDDAIDGSQSLVGVSASYNRRIGERLYAFVTPSYARASGGVLSDSRENYQVSFGVRYRLGDTE